MSAHSPYLEPVETYETEGPKCPYCGRQYTADEPFYYDETRYAEETCGKCHKTFDVEVCTSTSWTCTPRETTPPLRQVGGGA